MLSVRLGEYSSNDEALADTDYTDLIGTNLSGSEIDEIIIEREYNRVKEYYADNPEGERMAMDWKREAIKRTKEI